MVSERGKAWLLGIGLDNSDDEVRVTRGENFHLLGGSHETHELMQEKCIKLNEKLRSRDRKLEDLYGGEFLDLADECGINVARRRK